MKQCEQKRGLCFYRRDEKPWTQEQYKAICEYVGEVYLGVGSSIPYDRIYIFDNGDETLFMYPWVSQQDHFNFKNCKQVAYEDIFNEDGTVKGEQMEEEVTVEHAWQLAKMLEDGMKLTSDELADGYCYMTDSGDYRRVYDNGDETLMCRDEWNIKTWRKVKPQFKKYDVVEAKFYKNHCQSTIAVWSGNGIYSGSIDIYVQDIECDHYKPYTGPVPKHIQDFINEMKAKEK